MELASAVLFIFMIALLIVLIALPVMVISRVLRMLKKSIVKLFPRRAQKA